MDIRDIGMISRLADIVMGIWRVPNGTAKDCNRMKDCDEGDNWAKVRIWKNRRTGLLGSWFMEHNTHYLSEVSQGIQQKTKEEKLFKEQEELLDKIDFNEEQF
jgi:hypothetical protein